MQMGILHADLSLAAFLCHIMTKGSPMGRPLMTGKAHALDPSREVADQVLAPSSLLPFQAKHASFWPFFNG